MPTFVPRELAGWGRFPVQSCQVARPEKRRDIGRDASDAGVPDLIARGLGRAYGDAALNADSGVLLLEKLNRFLSFDAQSATLHAEGGASLAEILETFLPCGYFLPVVSGTRQVTLGGAIACDIHGKNHRADGCLSAFLDEFELLLASGEVLTCSRARNADAFWATIGGMGLTGIVLSAKVRLVRVESAFVSATYRRTRDLDETLQQLVAGDERFRVAWIDGLAAGARLGRGVVSRADYASAAQVPGDPLAYGGKRSRQAPPLPDGALNPLSVKAFNALYLAAHPDQQRTEAFEPFFWPLDSVESWNKIYGARGFAQYQCVLPRETARDGLKTLLETIAASGRAAFLGVLKAHGPQDEAPLSFPLEGFSLALDFPATDGIAQFARALDDITVAHGGRVYLAKDATLTPAAFRSMYARLDEWERVKARLDPGNRFASSLSKRLGIGNPRSGGTRSGGTASGGTL